MNIPKLRFKEFNDEWIEGKISDLIELNPKKSSLPESFIYIDLDSVSHGRLLKKKVINRIDAPSRAQRNVKLYDILYQTVRPYQKNNLYIDKLSELPYIASTGYAVLREKNIYSKFLFNKLYTYNFVNEVLDNCTGTSYPAINANDLGTIKIYYPSNVEEQRKIGDFLSLLDKKVELQNKKIEALKLFKLCILKHIFSSATVKTKLKNVSNITKGEQINSEELSKSGSYYMLNGGTEPSGYLEKYNTLENTITISEGGNSCGYVKYNKYKFWCGGHCYSIKNKLIDNHYLYQLLKFNEKKIMRLRIGSGLPNIQKKDLENFELFIHEKNNQYKIANLLMKYDTKIELEKNKLDKLTSLKTGLLQNMFI